MLFSGGTFLYVATVHILPELAHVSLPSTSGLPTDVADTGSDHHGVGFTKIELIVMVIGCLLPLILAVGHKH